jgi:uroporphyrin-III C-methyltransferase / precorrin-2 dehydrogenase / sirohydrochlorin ferrochelatase
MDLPLFLKTDSLPCLVIGGGPVAAHKVEILVAAGCALNVVAPAVVDSIRKLAAEGRLRWLARRYQPGDCAGYHLVISATSCLETNRAVSAEAAAAGIPVNVVDAPELCTVTFGASWSEGPLTISVSTGGAAPFMGAAIRNRITQLARGWGDWVEAAARFRLAVRREIADPNEKNSLYQRFSACMFNRCHAAAPLHENLADWLAYLECPDSPCTAAAAEDPSEPAD